VGRIRAVLNAASDVFRLDPGPPVQPVSSLNLAVEHFRSTAADRGLDKAFDLSSIDFRKRLNEIARAKREALLEETLEQLDRLTVLVPHMAERYRKELFDLASEGEPAPRDIDTLKERYRQEIEAVVARGELPHVVTWNSGRESEQR
jgi:phosphoglycolate phosphatase-like HAD superfamily hydrolase